MLLLEAVELFVVCLLYLIFLIKWELMFINDEDSVNSLYIVKYAVDFHNIFRI